MFRVSPAGRKGKESVEKSQEMREDHEIPCVDDASFRQEKGQGIFPYRPEK
jgi:hypothetical protein